MLIGKSVFGVIGCEPREEPEYRSERPMDRIMFASDGVHSVVLDCIGPAVDFLDAEIGALLDELDGHAAGLWIAQIYMVTVCEDGDYDADVVILGARPLTAREWEIFRDGDGEGPWDPGDWLESVERDWRRSPDDLPDGWARRVRDAR